MTPERWQRIQTLYAAAVELAPEARSAWLECECGGDSELRERIEALLRHDTGTDRTVSDAISQVAAELLQEQSSGLVGRHLGVWQLGRRIAQGGMGAVYLGERCDGQFAQRTAIKLLNPVLLSADALVRFNGERQILARLSHPNIAHLIDGGTTDEGMPYLVMEYIEGPRIDVYCRERSLDIRSRIELFMKICAAVEYAHRNLVVHRDIKPSNIVVDPHGEPKLLDFGVAKLIDRDRVDAAVTHAELRALTPRYASPEQLKGEAITTATDVYSLGVLLYELLSGRYPYDQSDSSVQSLQHAILATEPQRPSATAARSAETAESQAMRERSRRELFGDLDNIVLMALRKEPARRYGSPRELSEDLAKHLAHQPVLARADTLRYRASKFVRRNRTAVAAAILLSVLAAAQATFYTYRLVHERDAASAARVTAEEIARFLESIFEGANPSNAQGRVVSVRDLLDEAAARIDTLPAQPVARARLMHLIGATYADIDVRDAGIALMRRALEMRVKLFGAESLPVAESMDRLGYALSQQGQTQEGRELLEHALRTRRALAPGDSLEMAAILSHLAEHENIAGNFQQARQYAEQTKQMLERLDRTSDRFYANTLLHLGFLEGLAGNYVAEERYPRQAIEVSIAAGRPRDPLVATGYGNLADVLRRLHRYAEAEEFYIKAIALKREILGPRASDLDGNLTNFGRFYLNLGQLDKAEPLMLEAVELAREHLGEKHVYYAYDLANVARLRAAQRRYQEADTLFRTVLKTYEDAEGPDFHYLGSTRTDYGRVLLEAGRYADARSVLQQTLAFYARNPEHVKNGEGFDQDAKHLLGAALAQLGEMREAEQLLVEGYEGLLRSSGAGPDNRRTQAARERVVAFYQTKGDEETAASYRAAVQERN